MAVHKVWLTSLSTPDGKYEHPDPTCPRSLQCFGTFVRCRTGRKHIVHQQDSFPDNIIRALERSYQVLRPLFWGQFYLRHSASHTNQILPDQMRRKAFAQRLRLVKASPAQARTMDRHRGDRVNFGVPCKIKIMHFVCHELNQRSFSPILEGFYQLRCRGFIRVEGSQLVDQRQRKDIS